MIDLVVLPVRLFSGHAVRAGFPLDEVSVQDAVMAVSSFYEGDIHLLDVKASGDIHVGVDFSLYPDGEIYVESELSQILAVYGYTALIKGGKEWIFKKNT